MSKERNETIKRFMGKYSLYLLLLLMIVIMSIVKPNNFPTWNNLSNVLRQMTPVGIISLGMTFVIVTAGTDLSSGMMTALCSVLVAHFMIIGLFGIPLHPVIAVILTLAAGAAGGGLNGFLISYGGVPPFIGALAIMWVAKGLALLISGGQPITGFSKGFNFIGGGTFMHVISMPILIFIICCVISYIVLHKTMFGVHVFAIGGNKNAALVSGIHVKRVEMTCYIIAGVFTAIGAIVLTSRQQAGHPTTGTGYEMDAITCAIIGGASFSGGVGSISGTIVGVLILGVISNAMTMLQIDPYVQMTVKGILIAAAVLADVRKNRKK